MIFLPLSFSISGSHDPATYYEITSELGLEKMENGSGLPSSMTLESIRAFWCVHRVIRNIAALLSQDHFMILTLG